MSKVIVVGSGFAGHTAALNLRRLLGKDHDVHVITAIPYFQYFPSFVWVGVGHMRPEQTYFDLEPIYAKTGITYTHSRVTEINAEAQTVKTEAGQSFPYDYLINASGPYLNYEGTPGLGPSTGNTVSICNYPHAVETRDKYLACVEKMRQGKRQTMIVGTGHPGATCQGAAFEYIQNIHFDLKSQGLRDRCELVWFTNEPKLGDFGMGGFVFKNGNGLRTSEELTAWIMRDAGINTMTGTAPARIEPGKLFWENTQGQEGCLDFDMAMLIPGFLGQKIRYTNNSGEELNTTLCNPANFLKVDANYTPSLPSQWSHRDWPSTYQSPFYKNLFAAGIAFAPPHPISFPSGTSKNGLKIHASPPRTGMVSGIIGRAVAENVAGMINRGDAIPHRHVSMGEMPAACVASQRKSVWTGSAVTTILYPVVPNTDKHPVAHEGRDLNITMYEIGKGGAWIKRMLHSLFMYKLKANPGWHLIPE